MSKQATSHTKNLLFFVLVSFFCSGFSALVYEIAWLRELRLIFGDTVFAVTTILAGFMAGLALGSHLFGKVSDRRPQLGFRLYAWMEIAVGLYALCIPLLIKPATVLCISFIDAHRASFYELSLARFFVSFILLLPATTLMGGTFPVVIRAMSLYVRGGNVGRMYAINTAGGALGCLLAGFALIGMFSSYGAIILAAITNFTCGFLVLWVHRALQASAANTTEEPLATDQIELAASPPGDVSSLRNTVFWVAACSGFVALALEVVWVRMLAVRTTMHVQGFTVMLTIMLCAIAAGSALYAKWLRGRINPAVWLTGTQLAIGIWVLISVGIYQTIPVMLFPPYAPFSGFDMPPMRLAFTAIGPSFVLVLIPSLLMGLSLPIMVDLYSNARKDAGVEVGNIYAANLFGSIAGSFVAGFVMLPLLGMQGSMFVLAMTCALLAVALILTSANFRRTIPGVACLALAVVGLPLIGAVTISYGAPPVPGIGDSWHRIFYREGLTHTVRVFEDYRTGRRDLFADSWSIASTEHWAMKIQKLLAYLPLLIHKEPTQVLVIGFGTGTTSGTALNFPPSVEAVEIEPAQSESAVLFRHINNDVLNPKWTKRFRMVPDDGRNWLLTSQSKYDVISRDALLTKPSQDLFTREFFELAKSRLRPGGIFCGFLPYDTEPTSKMVLVAFHDVFPHGTVWFASPTILVLMASDTDLEIDYQELRNRMNAPSVKKDLLAINMAGPEDLLATFLMGGKGLSKLTSGYLPATDQHPLGYLNTPDLGGPRDIQSLHADLIANRESILPYLRNIDKENVSSRSLERVLTARFDGTKQLIEGQLKLMLFDDPQGARKDFMQTLQSNTDWQEARFQYSLALIAEADKLLADPPGSTPGENLQKAVGLLEEALKFEDTYPQLYISLGRAYEQMGQNAIALDNYKKAARILEEQNYPSVQLVQDKLRQ